MYDTCISYRCLRNATVYHTVGPTQPSPGAISPSSHGHSDDGRALDDDLQHGGGTRFYQCYQVNVGNEDDETEDDLSRDGEGVKSTIEGSHSLFGLIYQVAKDTGWSIEYIMKIPYATLTMMLADAPRYVRKKDKPIRITSKEQLFGVLGKKG